MIERMTRSLFTVMASLVAVALSLGLCAILLKLTGRDPWSLYGAMIDYGLEPRSLTDTLQRATPLIISGVAVAIGFKMNLFNIGVEGQYRMAMLLAAGFGAMVELPPVLHVLLCLIIAMIVGATWAGIAGVLKVKRGVNEVISTIMLNAIALGVIDWLFNEYFRVDSGGDLNVKSKVLPESAWVPNLISGQNGRVSWFFIIALAISAVYWVVVWFTPFGFRLRSSGVNPGAARVGGVNPDSMVLKTMLISGAVAGLVGMPAVLGKLHAFGQGLPKELGFAGIAVALLGRNHPIGIVLASLMFAFLDHSSAILQFEDVPKEITSIIQGITVLTVVIVNEALGRLYDRFVRNSASKKIEDSPPDATDTSKSVLVAEGAGA